VRADFVVSLDGAVEIGGRAKPLGAPVDRSAFMAMRAVADAVLVGAGTARIERYGPINLADDAIERRVARGQEERPRLVVVSRRGVFTADERMFSGDQRPVLVTPHAAVSEHGSLRDLADLVICGDKEVDLSAALDLLVERGWKSIVCEGGPTLLRDLLDADLVDEMCITHSPVVAGAQHLGLSGEVPLDRPTRFKLDGLLAGDGLLLARYARDRAL
jgi:riboflavin biosynthesis pyrimidine reductase